MANKFTDFLQHVGSFLKTVFTDATKVAEIAAPVVDIAFPEIASLYNFTVQQASLAEAAAAGVTGAGPQKLAAVVAAVLPFASAAAKNAGAPAPTTEHVTNYVNAVVASLKALPAPVVTQAPAQPEPAAA